MIGDRSMVNPAPPARTAAMNEDFVFYRPAYREFLYIDELAETRQVLSYVDVHYDASMAAALLL